MVHSLDHGVVVEHPATGGAYAHGQHPFGFGHLVIDLAQYRCHLLADPARDDHQVGLARGGREAFHTEAGDIEARTRGGHHFDCAAGQSECRRPQ
jgi:hypothetical protein